MQATTPSFVPIARSRDGEIVRGPGWTIEAVATPGHTANHMAFAYREANILFSGDHVMAWSTPVVAPPDGAMRDYMASLEKLARRSEPLYLPGHGGAVREAPRFVRSCIRHRQAREAVDPAPAGEGRSRYSRHCARHIYRARYAADKGGRPFGSCPYRGSGDARAGGDRRPTGDRQPLSPSAVRLSLG